MRLRRREENYVKTVPRKGARAGGLSEDPLAPVPEDGIPKPLSSDEGDPSRDALVAAGNSNSQERIVVAPPAREDPLKISLGLDGLQRCLLDGKTLAALGAATGQDGAAALGGHAGTEPVSGGALALVRLVGALHSYSSRLWV